MKVLVFGATGQFALSLADLGRTRSHGVFTLVGHDECDVADAARVAQVVAERAPDGVVNAAAYTAVDKAESDERRAYEINCIGAGNIARAAQAAGVALVHISTDYVFDGNAHHPYREDDPVFPLSAYGRSKLAGEYAVRAACARSITLRTSWLFSHYGSNFVKTMLRLAEERDSIKVVDDQLGKPTCAADLAVAAVTALRACVTDPAEREVGRLYHFAGPEAMSWRRFAEKIMIAAHARGRQRAEIVPIPTASYPTPAVRPRNSRLDTSLGETILGLSHRAIDDCLEEVIEAI